MSSASVARALAIEGGWLRFLASAILAGCGDPTVVPTPVSVSPQNEFEGVPVPIVIHGEGFAPEINLRLGGSGHVDVGFRAWLGNAELDDVTYVDQHTLAAEIPDVVSAGVYPLRVEAPDGQEGTLEEAFELKPCRTDIDGDALFDCRDFCRDRDGDGVGDADGPRIGCSIMAVDSNEDDRWLCANDDGDACDDCGRGEYAPSDDGLDTNDDGLCESAGAITTPGAGVLVAGSTSLSIPVDPALDPAQTVLAFNATHASVSPETGQVMGVLNDDGTSLNFSRLSAGGAIDVALRWQLVEIPGALVQRGEVPLDAAGPWTVELPTAVAVDRSLVLASLMTPGQTYGRNDWVLLELVDAQTLVLNTGWGCCSGRAAWQVVELPPSAHVEHGTAVLDDGVLELTYDLEELFTVDRSFMTFSQRAVGNGAAADHLMRGRLLPSGQVVFDRDRADIEVTVGFSVVRSDAFFVQRGDLHFAAGEVELRATLNPAVVPTRSLSLLPGMWRQGKAPWSGGDDVGVAWFTSELSVDGTEIVLRRGSALSAADARWVVVEIH